MRKIVYIFLLIFGIPFWTIAVTFLTFVVWLCVLGHKVWPTTDYGNCWTYALRRWAEEGGYVCIRSSVSTRFLGRFPVPHILWAPSLREDMHVEQFLPIHRKQARWLPWFILWYHGEVRTTEPSRDWPLTDA